MEQYCIMCCSPRAIINEVIDSDKITNSFKAICNFLKIDFVGDDWSFEEEHLPMCHKCLEIVKTLEELTFKMDQIELEIYSHVETLKREIRSSSSNCNNKNKMVTRSASANTSHEHGFVNLVISERFNRFRNQVLNNKNIRHIGTHRLNNIVCGSKSGQSIDDLLSQSSIDCLSQASDDESTTPDSDYSLPSSPVNNDDQGIREFLNFENLSNNSSLFKWTEQSDGRYYSSIKVIISGESERKDWSCGHVGCDYVLSSDTKHPKKSMEYHIKTRHLALKKCLAPNCGKLFADEQLELHIKKQHTHTSTNDCSPSASKPLRCSIPKCKKEFKNPKMFKRHENMHVENGTDGPLPPKRRKMSVQSFTCPHCDKQFQKKSNLERHQSVHQPDKGKTELCPECGGMYSKDGLVGHRREVHKKGDKVFACAFDNCIDNIKIFPSQARLNKHYKVVHSKSWTVLN